MALHRRGRPRRGGTIEKDHSFNMDAQDVQDNQDGRLLHKRLTPAMIACGFQVELLIHSDKRTVEFNRLTRSNTGAQ